MSEDELCSESWSDNQACNYSYVYSLKLPYCFRGKSVLVISIYFSISFLSLTMR